ncbi:carbohydrate kinase family protein [Candidatus Bathyarchaeota archaeon]|nr:carbohydrate kinase family protein [Candidatus Bathyarchaeota archaeon]
MVDLICCGAINWDINLFMDRLPRTGEEVPVNTIQRVSGGTAANVSVASARILGPGRVAFIGALGEDAIAEEQINILEEEGVDPSGILLIPNEESGQAYISISKEGANEIHTYFGANLRITGDHMMDRERLSMIVEAKVCVIMDPPIETARKLAELCRKNGVKVIWDPGVYAEEGLEALLPTLVNVDYFILNHIEYENLLGTSDPKKVTEELTHHVKDIKAIIKHGAEGCILCEDDGATIIQMEAVPLLELGLKVVNTVGCGDAFIGGFASALVEGKDHIEALREASAAGSYKATRIETRGGPTREQLQKLIDVWKRL